MGNYKIDNYLNEQLGKLWKESREQRAFDLGYARGMFELYKYLAENNYFDDTDKVFEPIARGNEHFQKYVELYKAEESESERSAYKFQEYKDFKERTQNNLIEEKLETIESLDKELRLFEKRKSKNIDMIIEEVDAYRKLIEIKKKSLKNTKSEMLK